MSNEPVCCDLNVFDNDQLREHKRHAEGINRGLEEIREVDGGYGFRLNPDPETIHHAGAFISGEKQCCPFFNFRLEVPAKNGPVWLYLTGSDGAKRYLYEQVVKQGRFD